MPALQIRNVPEDVHAVLRKRAEAAGQSLSEYLLALVAVSASTPTLEEWFAELDTAGPVDVGRDAAQLIREERDAREGFTWPS